MSELLSLCDTVSKALKYKAIRTTSGVSSQLQLSVFSVNLAD